MENLKIIVKILQKPKNPKNLLGFDQSYAVELAFPEFPPTYFGKILQKATIILPKIYSI
jgi:hypothetical protein